MDEKENFLERWSRRKRSPDDDQEQIREDTDNDQNAELANAEQSSAETPQEEAAEPQEPAPWEGVDIEKLDADSDYTVFMAEGVPDNVRKDALDKLWRSDPVFANLDGLNDYDEDYSKWGMVNQVVKSAYKIGQGYLTDEEVAASQAAREAEDAAAAATQEDAGTEIAANEPAPDVISQEGGDGTPQREGADQPAADQAEGGAIKTEIIDDEPDEVA